MGVCSPAAPGLASGHHCHLLLCSTPGKTRGFAWSYNPYKASPPLFLPAGFLLQKPWVSCSWLGKGRDSWPWGPTSRALPPGRRRTGSGHAAPAFAGLHVPLQGSSGRTDTVILTGGERRTRLWGAKSGRGDLVSGANEKTIPLCNRLFREGFSSMEQRGGKEKFQVHQPRLLWGPAAPAGRILPLPGVRDGREEGREMEQRKVGKGELPTRAHRRIRPATPRLLARTYRAARSKAAASCLSLKTP